MVETTANRRGGTERDVGRDARFCRKQERAEGPTPRVLFAFQSEAHAALEKGSAVLSHDAVNVVLGCRATEIGIYESILIVGWDQA